MGKRIKTRRRGSGRPKYLAPSHHFKSEAKYRDLSENEIRGRIAEFEKDPSKQSLLMKIQWEDGVKYDYIAPEGIAVNDEIHQHTKKIALGNVMKIVDIPEGVPFFNVEAVPGDGGRMVRTTGSSATIVAKQQNQVVIKLPSKKLLPIREECRATIGVVAGGGRTDKPLIKAGNMFFKMRARRHLYPIVRGVAMNPVAHPHGGTQHHAGKATTVRRTTPPGRKVGHIAARRTGRKKRK
jgi:large subunit ribosomal protein L2